MGRTVSTERMATEAVGTTTCEVLFVNMTLVTALLAMVIAEWMAVRTAGWAMV